MNYRSLRRCVQAVKTILTRGAIFAGIALLATALVPASPIISAVSPTASERERLFGQAAAEFAVPKELLLAISYNQTRWENHDGKPSASGGYGLMHLTAEVEREDGRGDPSRPLPERPQLARHYTLAEAAGEIKADVSTVQTNDTLNVRAGAALLAKYAKASNNGQVPSSLGGWQEAVKKLSGLSDDKAADFSADVYATVANGASETTIDGQTMALVPTPNTEEHLRKQPVKSGDTECPRTIICKWESAYFGQNNPNDPTDYGNIDTANRPKDMKVKYIVIHDTEGSYRSSIDWFKDPASYVAAHYLIRSSDGEVTQMVKNKDIGWHAGNWYMNMHSIGVEHEGYAAEGATWYTEAMYRSSAKLVRYLAEKYDIPLDREHIVGHDQYHGLTPARAKQMHTDPGPYWDWDYYMKLLGEPVDTRDAGHANAVTITPKFSTNKQPVTECKEGTCTLLPSQGTNFVYLRTAPNTSAPLLTDAGLHPDGAAGTTEISDWSAKAMHGQRFALAGREGNWTAIWFGGQKGWFYDPVNNRTATQERVRTITPKTGKTSIPIYGRPMAEPAAFTNGVPAQPIVPLQYVMLAGQEYVAYDRTVKNDFYYVSTFDRSAPGDGKIIIGNEEYIPVAYNHRQAFVKASDVQLASN